MSLVVNFCCRYGLIIVGNCMQLSAGCRTWRAYLSTIFQAHRLLVHGDDLRALTPFEPNVLYPQSRKIQVRCRFFWIFEILFGWKTFERSCFQHTLSANIADTNLTSSDWIFATFLLKLLNMCTTVLGNSIRLRNVVYFLFRKIKCQHVRNFKYTHAHSKLHDKKL